ncbi:hypothetical protein Pcar_2893 [Syntrophotalea carbinolica DSM 2380]|uniref:Contractile injection system tube protein N-terminal domain-containing protein n=1 Tax=Syntrophotalea carbinolica (strain DSM 2380 / NBRC 103641 / GraBd1) TaxID=338963 RepID=Q3A0H9_SYNC1|nr:hypothetical protein [Syntrophotalea carbinolica]ABA90128.1 hypothetical protein Pcar_2893 [Syntrophotalea carbinolica DSM 2380]
MEKVVLLIEHSGVHLRCMLNPEYLEVQRNAGVVVRRSLGGALTGADLSDDPLLYVGGGRTELTLDLLFDVSLATRGPDTVPLDDVRELTGPLWELAENSGGGERYGRPPTVRFIWGTSWNLPGVVAAVSERLEHFTRDGKPHRSWLRLRLLRISCAETAEPSAPPAPPVDRDEARQRIAAGTLVNYDPVGGDGGGERLDQISAERFGHPGYWSLLAEINDLDNPLRHAGRTLRVPAEPTFGGGGGRA